MAEDKPDKKKKKPAPEGGTAKRSKGGGSLLGRALWMLALLCIYALSFFAAAWGIHQLPAGSQVRKGASTVAQAVYWPLTLLQRNVPMAKECYDWGWRKLSP